MIRIVGHRHRLHTSTIITVKFSHPPMNNCFDFQHRHRAVFNRTRVHCNRRCSVDHHHHPYLSSITISCINNSSSSSIPASSDRVECQDHPCKPPLSCPRHRRALSIEDQPRVCDDQVVLKKGKMHQRHTTIRAISLAFEEDEIATVIDRTPVLCHEVPIVAEEATVS